MNLQSDPNSWAVTKFGIGQPVKRSEDPKLVRGEGRFTDDVSAPRQAHAVMVRSRHAHGIIRAIDTAAARAMPGVLGVYTGADLAAAGYGTLKCIVPFKNRDGSDMKKPRGRRCRPTRCVSSAIPWPAWSPRRCCRRRTPPRR
jgi:carbon-monoxide dehydrogenase large subunit